MKYILICQRTDGKLLFDNSFSWDETFVSAFNLKQIRNKYKTSQFKTKIEQPQSINLFKLNIIQVSL